jgi:uncharacterized protein (TIGR03067 family)
MKHMFITSVAIMLMAFVSANAQTTPSQPAKTKNSDVEAMQGVWKTVEAVLGGETLPQQALEKITLKITGDKYEVTVEDQPHNDKGITKLDASAKPKRIEITSTEGANKGKTYLAIYEFTGADSFKVCYDLSGTAFPTKFESAKDTLLYLVTYERQKK